MKIICPDCELEYEAGASHRMLCSVKTCDECDSTFSYVLPVYDSRTDPVTRLCDNCLEDRLDQEEDE